jgi:hypothetical protein
MAVSTQIVTGVLIVLSTIAASPTVVLHNGKLDYNLWIADVLRNTHLTSGIELDIAARAVTGGNDLLHFGC